MPINQACKLTISVPEKLLATTQRAPTLAAQKSHRKIAVTTVAATGLATVPLQKSQGFSLCRPQKNRQPLAIFGVSLKNAGSSQRPRPQVAAAARFRSRSDHGTLKPRLSDLDFPVQRSPPNPLRSGAALMFGPAPLQRFVGDSCTNFGGFCWGFSRRIFLGTFFPIKIGE